MDGQQDRSSEEEDGDGDRIDQQMGDVSGAFGWWWGVIRGALRPVGARAPPAPSVSLTTTRCTPSRRRPRRRSATTRRWWTRSCGTATTTRARRRASSARRSTTTAACRRAHMRALKGPLQASKQHAPLPRPAPSPPETTHSHTYPPRPLHPQHITGGRQEPAGVRPRPRGADGRGGARGAGEAAGGGGAQEEGGEGAAGARARARWSLCGECVEFVCWEGGVGVGRECGAACVRWQLSATARTWARARGSCFPHSPCARAQPGPEEQEGDDGGASEGEGGEEGGVNDDIDDRFEEQHNARPQARNLASRARARPLLAFCR